MRALQVQELIGPDGMKLAEVPEPDAHGNVLIDVHAAGVNFPDLLMTKGEYQVKMQPPFIPGNEVAGVVRSAPEGSPFQVGDRVVGFPMIGGYAETVAVVPAAVAPLPEGLDFAEGASLVCNYQTAHFALHRRGRIAEGDTVVVLGAAGGVGTAAIQVAKGSGSRVIAVVHRAGAEEFLREIGADEVVGADAEWGKRVKELTGGRGADIVVDPVGGEAFQTGLRCLAPEGRILVIGFAGGGIPELKVNRLLLRNVSAVGVAWGAFLMVEGTLFAEIAESLDGMVRSGHIKPPIAARYPLADGMLALADLADGKVRGKAVLEVR